MAVRGDRQPYRKYHGSCVKNRTETTVIEHNTAELGIRIHNKLGLILTCGNATSCSMSSITVETFTITSFSSTTNKLKLLPSSTKPDSVTVHAGFATALASVSYAAQAVSLPWRITSQDDSLQHHIIDWSSNLLLSRCLSLHTSKYSCPPAPTARTQPDQ